MAKDKPQIVGIYPMVADLLHYGHLAALQEVRKYCDYLVVALNANPDHKNRKPVETVTERYYRLSYCSLVDKILIYSGEKELRDIYSEGDYDLAFISEEHRESYTNPRPATPVFIKRIGDYSSTNLRHRIKTQSNGLIVVTSGGWDLGHAGHVSFLRQSKELGEKLIVGIKTDKVIFEQKGYKPILNLHERVTALKLCGYVDHVHVHGANLQNGLKELFDLYNPDIFTCGTDRTADPFILPLLDQGYKVDYRIINSGIPIHATELKERIRNADLNTKS